ncbi:MAG: hypothetical protein R2769_02740 [Saprospiraceae bacterium]
MGNKVGYFMGSGDEIPQSLNQIVMYMLNEKDYVRKILVYDAVIMGIRAYNTHERLRNCPARIDEIR